METYEQKRRRLFGKLHLDKYLKELNSLVKIEVKQNALLSVEETDNIGTVEKTFSHKCIIKFSDKFNLLLLIAEIIGLKDYPCYLYTSYSYDCGVLQLNSIKEFNVNFSFDDEHTGLITIKLKDLSNQILFDFYEEDNERFIQIEIYGKEWSNANIN